MTLVITNGTIILMIEKDVYLVPTLVAPLAVIEFAKAHPDLLSPSARSPILQT